MSVSYNFAGKVVLITGGGSGIGAATAVEFARSGAQVVIGDINTNGLTQVAKQCLNVSPNALKALEVLVDVTKEEDLQRLVDTTITTCGQLDILVNNAGVTKNSNINDPDYMSVYKRILSTNLDSTVHLTHLCVKYLEKTKGVIVNTSSVTAYQATPDFSPYCMSKAAINMFTKCMAAELGRKGIRVNSVNPGFIKSKIHSGSGFSEDVIQQISQTFANKYPVGRVGEGLDVANTIIYLASDQASFITGASVLVDGGHIAGSVTF